MGERDREETKSRERERERERERTCDGHDQALWSGPPLESKDVQDELQGGNLLPLGSRPLFEVLGLVPYQNLTMLVCVHVYMHMHGCVCMCVFVCMYKCMHTCIGNIPSHVFLSILICVFAIVILQAKRAPLVLKSLTMSSWWQCFLCEGTYQGWLE